jgi:hypothetical protein
MSLRGSLRRLLNRMFTQIYAMNISESILKCFDDNIQSIEIDRARHRRQNSILPFHLWVWAKPFFRDLLDKTIILDRCKAIGCRMVCVYYLWIYR